MRILKINSILIDIDEQTALGITFQGYDMKNPAQPRSVNYSNNFSIPLSANNIKTFGFAGDPQSKSTLIYQKLTIDYWLDNIHIINNGQCRIDYIQDRIVLFVYDNIDLWSEIKSTPYDWQTFQSNFLEWVNYPSTAFADLISFVKIIETETNGCFSIPLYMSNMYGSDYEKVKDASINEQTLSLYPNYIDSDGYVTVNIYTSYIPDYITSHINISANESITEAVVTALLSNSWVISRYEVLSIDPNGDENNGWVTMYAKGTQYATFRFSIECSSSGFNVVNGGSPANSINLQLPTIKLLRSYVTVDSESKTVKTGHVCVPIIKIFKYLESVFPVNFHTEDESIISNIFTDSYLPKIMIPMRNINIDYADGNVSIIYIAGTFYPLEVLELNGIFLYDIINSYLNTCNAIIDSETIDGVIHYYIRKFDEIKDNAGVINWSDKLTNRPIFKPYIEGFAYQNYINFKMLYKNAPLKLGSKLLTSTPQLMDTQDLFDIDSYIGNTIGDTLILDLSTEESFSNICFLINYGTYYNSSSIYSEYESFVNISCDGFSPPFGVLALKKASKISIDNRYDLWNEVLANPKYYEVQCWLTMYDVNKLQFFRLVYFKQLGGAFFVNKISNFNPEMSSSPATLELIFITNKTPDIKEFSNKVWVDGINNPFIDGVENNFI